MAEKKKELLQADKEFFKMKIGSLTERLERTKQRCDELEKENADVKKQFKTLEEESSDIIAHLKRHVTNKQEEIKIVTEKLQALQSTKATEKDKYQELIQSLEKDFKTMHDTFTAEVKLLAGQLSSLESFKNNREAMVKNLISLEEELKKKDEHHALALRNNENKYILMKEKLSAYVEEKLVKLSLDLQKQTQYTISETTHNIVKENIAINNELNLIIGSWQKIVDKNEELTGKNTSFKQELEIANELKDKTLEKNYVLNQLITRLAEEQEKLFQKLHDYEKDAAEKQRKLDECITENMKMILTMDQSEKTNKLISEELKNLQKEHKEVKIHNYKLEKIIKKTVTKIQEVIGLQEGKTVRSLMDEEEFTLRRQLLNSLLDLFDSFSSLQTEKPSDFIGSSESEEDLTWIKASPTLKNCPFINIVKSVENKNCEEQQEKEKEKEEENESD